MVERIAQGVLPIRRWLNGPLVSRLLVLLLAFGLLFSLRQLPPAFAQGAVTWLPADVFVAVSNGTYQVYSNTGTLKQSISDGLGGFTTGCAFNSAGSVAPALTRLYTTNFFNTKVVVYANALPHGILQTIDTGATSPGGHSESIVFNAAGGFYVGHPDGNRLIHKYNAAGTLVTTFSAAVENRGTDWIDLAVDQKTLVYASEGRRILRFDVSTASQLSDFANLTSVPGTFFALRLLPPGDGSGGLLVANLVDIKRLDGAGGVAQTYSVAGESSWFALSLDPNGTSFWAGNFSTSNFYRFNIFTGAVELGPINTGTATTPPGTLFGLCLKTPIISTLASGIQAPTAVAVDQPTGDVYIADKGTHQILKVSGGTITTVAGTGTAGFSGDGGPATAAQLNSPTGVAVTRDSGNNLIMYIADLGNQRIRRVFGGTITTFAGNGNFGFSGDGGPATSAQLYNPKGLAVDAAGFLYIVDSFNQRIRTVSPAGTISTVAGDGASTIVDPVLCLTFTPIACLGDGGSATAASLNSPTAVVVDPAGNLFFVDQGNNRIRRVTAGTITTVAGTGTAGFSGDGGSATAARLNAPTGLALDAAGNLIIGDGGNSRIRRVDAVTQVIGTVGGTGVAGFNLDNIPATFAQFTQPNGVAVDPAGNPLILDVGNHRLRKISFGP